MKKPEHVKIKAKEMTADLIDQYYIRAKDYEKFDVMTCLLDVQKPESTIIFARTKRRVDELAHGLEARGYKAEGIHGDLTQEKRMSVLRAFKNSLLDILVATDVAARGLDISGVTHVYNYDIPQDPESYVHRIGRTGRAGNEGLSVTFVTPNEIGYLHTIERLTKKKISPMRPPTDSEAFRGALGAAFEEISAKIKAKEDLLEKYGVSADKLLTRHSAEEVAAYLLSTLAALPKDQAKVTITPERPLPERRRYNNGNNRQGYTRDNRYSRKSSYKRDEFNLRDKDRRFKNNRNNKKRGRGSSFEKRQSFVIRNKGDK
jgi:ATP-dependent RNA helicase DeaD